MKIYRLFERLHQFFGSGIWWSSLKNHVDPAKAVSTPLLWVTDRVTLTKYGHVRRRKVCSGCGASTCDKRSISDSSRTRSRTGALSYYETLALSSIMMRRSLHNVPLMYSTTNAINRSMRATLADFLIETKKNSAPLCDIRSAEVATRFYK
jgi:hypothetical protein